MVCDVTSRGDAKFGRFKCLDRFTIKKAIFCGVALAFNLGVLLTLSQV